MPVNIYLPQLARVASIKEEVAGERSIKTFRVEPVDGKLFDHQCGQCAMVSIFARCGLAPIWPVITTAVAQRANFKNITVFYGGRTSRDIMYRAELEKLRESVDVHLSIDKAEEGWDGYCGFVPAAVMDRDPVPDNAIAITCGATVLIKFVIQNLNKLGFKDEQIYTTNENNIKCGLGKHGLCNVG